MISGPFKRICRQLIGVVMVFICDVMDLTGIVTLLLTHPAALASAIGSEIYV